MSIQIRPLLPNDFPNWLPLWDANNLGHKNEKVTTETWSRLTNENSAVCGICALKNGEMVGLVHYILHPTTGAIEHACYMQDVYVDENYRGQGIAKKMIIDLIEIGKKEKWSRLYWLADAENEAAQALYKNIGIKMNFTLHIQPLSGI